MRGWIGTGYANPPISPFFAPKPSIRQAVLFKSETTTTSGNRSVKVFKGKRIGVNVNANVSFYANRKQQKATRLMIITQYNSNGSLNELLSKIEIIWMKKDLGSKLRLQPKVRTLRLAQSGIRARGVWLTVSMMSLLRSIKWLPSISCCQLSKVATMYKVAAKLPYIHTYIHKLYFLSNFRVACNTINISS